MTRVGVPSCDYTLHDWLPAHPLLLAKVKFVVATCCSLGIVVPDFVSSIGRTER